MSVPTGITLISYTSRSELSYQAALHQTLLETAKMASFPQGSGVKYVISKNDQAFARQKTESVIMVISRMLQKHRR